jgi:cytochrome oxidase assembly protein ShyY1
VSFLLSRRWVLFALAVVMLALLCVRLGQWQFHRLHEREQRNEWTSTNLARDPAPVEDVLALDRPLPPDREWMRVKASGQYDAAATVVVRYQSREGESGVDLVTPLVTADGTAVLVDRGWLATPNTGARPADLPAPPAGTVSVTGYARADATGDITTVTDRSTRAVSSVAIGRSVDRSLFAGYVALGTESPDAADPLVAAELPDLGEGPHLFYGIQWWFFGALALFGFGYLAWDERRRKLDGTTDETSARVTTR